MENPPKEKPQHTEQLLPSLQVQAIPKISDVGCSLWIALDNICLN